MSKDIRRAFDEMLEPPHPALRAMVRARLESVGKGREVGMFQRFAKLGVAAVAIIVVGAVTYGLIANRDGHQQPGRNGVSVSPSPSQPVTATPTPAPPPGGPVPAALLGDWFLPPASVAANTNMVCPSPPTGANCFYRLSFTAMNYRQWVTGYGGTLASGSGEVVVNGNEIDFYNGALCGIHLPDGVGRYTWTVTGGVLRFTLISDPCPRSDLLTYGGWSRTH
jgi:hypothetical protein